MKAFALSFLALTLTSATYANDQKCRQLNLLSNNNTKFSCPEYTAFCTKEVGGGNMVVMETSGSVTEFLAQRIDNDSNPFNDVEPSYDWYRHFDAEASRFTHIGLKLENQSEVSEGSTRDYTEMVLERSVGSFEGTERQDCSYKVF